MCLYIKDNCYIETAKKDIVTFKEVIERKSYWEPAWKGSEFYKYNKVLTARRSPYTPTNTIKHLQAKNNMIHEGFHSRVICTDDCNKICIIPKGSEICYGDVNDIVSLHIIVFKHMWNYLWYKLWHR